MANICIKCSQTKIYNQKVGIVRVEWKAFLSSLLTPGPYLPASRLAPALGSPWPHGVAPGPSPTHGKARGWCASQGSESVAWRTSPARQGAHKGQPSAAEGPMRSAEGRPRARHAGGQAGVRSRMPQGVSHARPLSQDRRQSQPT